MIDFNLILKDKNFSSKQKEGIEAGLLRGTDEDALILMMELWCKRIDRLIDLDYETNRTYTNKSDELIKYRGITISEFRDLYNSNIETEHFPFYRAFQFLGIRSSKKRSDFTMRYETNNKETYYAVIKKYLPPDLFHFFLSKRSSPILPLEAMKKHTSIIAPTGGGKSEYLRHIIFQINQQYPEFPVILIDPLGKLARKIYHSKPKEYKDRFVYLDIDFKKGHTFTINPFELNSNEERDIRFAVENIIFIFNDLLKSEEKLNPIQKYMLQKCIKYIFTRQDSGLDKLLELLKLEPKIRQEAIEYDNYFGESFTRGTANSTRSAILGRLGSFIEKADIDRILIGNRTLSLETLINQGKTILFNLVNFPSSEAQPAFGKILVTIIKNLAEKRDPENHVPCFLVIDECHLFISGNYEDLLSRFRNFGIHLILSNQHTSQLKDQLESVVQNTAIKIARNEYESRLNNFIEVPNRYLKNSENGGASGVLDLEQFEFLLKITGQRMLKIKSPDTLIKSNQYSLTDEEIVTLDNANLENYYTKIKDIGVVENEEESSPAKPSKTAIPQNNSSSNQSPPFDLHINEEE